MFSSDLSDLAKTVATIVGVLLATAGLLLTAYTTFKNIKSRRLLNYQEIIKSHREIWKLALDKPEKFGRILDARANLPASPVTAEERRFVNLLLLHMTSAFYFAKHSDIIEIEKLRDDVGEVISLPIPLLVWRETSRYFNNDFVRFVEQDKLPIAKFLSRLIRRRWPSPRLRPTRRWTVLVLSAFAERLVRPLSQFGDHLVFVNSHDFEVSEGFLHDNGIDLVVCFGYGRIIKPRVLRVVHAINIHGGYLPYNRGPNPNLWSLIDGTPRGVSVHYIDSGVDTGDVIAQRLVDVPSKQFTVQSSFEQLVGAAIDLFEETWPVIRSGRSMRVPQAPGGTKHTLASQLPLQELMNEEGLTLPFVEFRARALALLGQAARDHGITGVASTDASRQRRENPQEEALTQETRK